MIKFDRIRPYIQTVDRVNFVVSNPNRSNAILYFPENIPFTEMYPFGNFRILDGRFVWVPTIKFPLIRLTPEKAKIYRKMKLVPVRNYDSSYQKNFFIDLSDYVFTIETKFKPTSYRMKYGMWLTNTVNNHLNVITPMYNKIVIYGVDLDRPIGRRIYQRKIFPILDLLRDPNSNPPFDYLFLMIKQSNRSFFKCLVQNKEYNYARFLHTIKSLSPTEQNETETPSEEAIQPASVNIKQKAIEIISRNVSIDSKSKKALDDFLDADLSVAVDMLGDHPEEELKDKSKEIVTAALLYGSGGDLEGAKRISRSIPAIQKDEALEKVEKELKDEILKPIKIKQTSTDPIVSNLDVIEFNRDKVPTQLFEKRRVDFEVNLKKDLENVFKSLESKKPRLKLVSIEIVDVPVPLGELEPSRSSFIIVKLKDVKGKIQEVRIRIPKIDPETGTFEVNGRKKCIINQTVMCPIAFLKPYEAKFSGIYSTFRIYSKRTRTPYLEAYFAAYKLPLCILLGYYIGMEEMCKLFKIKYAFVKEKPEKNITNIKLSEGLWLIFLEVKSEVQKQFVQSFIQADFENYHYLIRSDFGTREYFHDFIVIMTGRRNSTYVIQQILENVVDPVARQVLINKNQPIRLDNIIYYMSSRVVTGQAEPRNSLEIQRIRNSEVIVHLTHKLVMSAYTVYREQYLSGNEEAMIEINTDTIMKDFVKADIVADMEYLNPVEEMATVTRITPMGRTVGGLSNRRAVTVEDRSVHPTYFGTIDPMDTPESSNIGINQQLAIDAALTTSRGIIRPHDISDDIGSGMLSTTVAQVPFVSNNDGCRVMFAGSQLKQAVPLKYNSPPIIQTGYESILTNVVSSSFAKKAKLGGVILDATEDYIRIRYNDGSIEVIDITPEVLRSGGGKNGLSVFISKVVKGQRVAKGQILAEGSGIRDGSIALGTSLLAAFMQYKGYTFEDSMVVCEDLVDNDKLTSIHLQEIQLEIGPKDKVRFVTEIDKTRYTERGEIIFRKLIGDITELIGMEEKELTGEIIGGEYVEKSPGGRIVDIQVMCNTAPEKYPLLTKLIERTNRRFKTDKYYMRGKPIKGALIKFIIEQDIKISVGDKMCNRHGNKGTVGLVEKSEFMPITPWGERVELILNPLGIYGRMNMGQIYELYCGLIAKELSNRMTKLERTIAIQQIVKIVSLLDKTKNSSYTKQLAYNLKTLPKTKYDKIVNDIKTKGYVFPLIIPPFQAPSYKNIQDCMNLLKLRDGYQLTLPEFNTKTTNKISVGYMYINKLEHMSELKISARSTGKTTYKTSQPTAGKRLGGGQKFGEGETYTLISHNAIDLLAEFMGPLSDDFQTKNEIIAEIIETGIGKFKSPRISPTRQLLISYFTALMLIPK